MAYWPREVYLNDTFFTVRFNVNADDGVCGGARWCDSSKNWNRIGKTTSYSSFCPILWSGRCLGLGIMREVGGGFFKARDYSMWVVGCLVFWCQ